MSAKKKKKTAGEEAYVAASRDLYEWYYCLLVALILCVLLFAFIVRTIDVSGTSMVPTLYDSDKMLVSGLFYKPKVGDIVVFKKDEYDPNKALVKRVIAVEGQEINMDFENGIVYIDGAPIAENYISELTHNKLDFIGPKTVPEGCVFVMGDNRNRSTDSRSAAIGCVDTRCIIGRALLRLAPLNQFGRIG